MAVVDPVRNAHQGAGPAAGSGLAAVIAELARLRDTLRLFPAGWTGAPAVHREAARVDALLAGLQRAANPTAAAARIATERLAALLENGARPDIAMQMVLREAMARQFPASPPAGTATALESVACAPRVRPHGSVRSAAPASQALPAAPVAAAPEPVVPPLATPAAVPGAIVAVRANPAPATSARREVAAPPRDPLERAARQALDEARLAAQGIP